MNGSVTMQIGVDKDVIIRSNPKDSNTPPQFPNAMSNVGWALDTNLGGTANIAGFLGTFNQGIVFSLGAAPNPGTHVITMVCQGKTATYTVTVLPVPGPGPMDHFEPTNDPPTP